MTYLATLLTFLNNCAWVMTTTETVTSKCSIRVIARRATMARLLRLFVIISALACVSAQCGDGFKAGIEECDDGNMDSGDGCSVECMVECGYSCDGPTPTSADICDTTCGDGVLAGAEVCDDGNTVGGDGCTGDCTVEDGYTCTDVA